MVKEYKTLLIAGYPTPMVNAAAVEGWQVIAVTDGGFDGQGNYHLRAVTVWLERDHRATAQPDLPAESTISIRPAIAGPPKRRGRPPKTRPL